MAPTCQAKATHSLSYLRKLNEPFIGPLATTHILQNCEHPTWTDIDSGRVTVQLYPSRPSSLQLDRLLFQGRVWDAFRGTWSFPTPPLRTPAPPLVVKLTSPDINDMALADMRAEVTREAWIYDNVISHLQNKTVPRFYGVYSSVQASQASERGSVMILAAVMDYAGDQMGDWRMQQMSVNERKTILSKYGELHEAGVIHTSCSKKHWLKPYGSAMTGLKIVDFGQSFVRNDFDGDVPSCIRILGDTEFESRAEAEDMVVERRLGLC